MFSEKEKEVHEFRILKQINYLDVMAILYVFLNECLNSAYFLNLLFMNVKIVGSWKNNGKGEMLFDNMKNHKIDSWSKKKQWKACKKKREEKEKASRKSQ